MGALSPVTIALYHPALEEVARALAYAVAALGPPSRIAVQRVYDDGLNIILAPERIRDWDAVPADSVLFNTEQLGLPSDVLNTAYLRALRAFTVWDYSPRNLEWLRQFGAPSTDLVRIGYMPQLTRLAVPPVQDIDVLFYGAMTDRRRQVIAGLRHAGLAVVTLDGMTGPARDHHIERAKVVLNLHRLDGGIFEIVRVGHLLANRKAVVTEIGPQTEIDDDLRDTVAGVPYDRLVETCAALVCDDVARRALEERAFTLFAHRSQTDLLAGALRRQLDRRLGETGPQGAAG